MSPTNVSADEFRRIEAFLYYEARLADESRYEEWERLLGDDFHYWVPHGPANYSPSERISYINDHRQRVSTRIRQLQTGIRHAQSPPSPMRRVISNIEVLEQTDDGYIVGSNFVLYELSVQATHSLRLWAGRATIGLRRRDESYEMTKKVIELVNASHAIPSLAFIL